MGYIDITTIKSEIISILEGIDETANFDGFANVYGYIPNQEDLEGSPNVFVLPISISNDSGRWTTTEDLLAYLFEVRIVVSVEPIATREAVQNQLDRALNHVLQTLEENYQNANWLLQKVTSVSYDYSNTDFLISSLMLEIRKLNNIS